MMNVSAVASRPVGTGKRSFVNIQHCRVQTVGNFKLEFIAFLELEVDHLHHLFGSKGSHDTATSNGVSSQNSRPASLGANVHDWHFFVGDRSVVWIIHLVLGGNIDPDLKSL